MKSLFTLIACAGIVYGAVWGTRRILETQPKAQREGATRQTAMLVGLTEATSGTFEPEIVVLGRVRPERELEITPEVLGRVVRRSEGFTPGGVVEPGELLIEIEGADYRNVVRQRESAVEQAHADHLLELGRQKVAQQDFEMLGEEAQGGLDEAQRRLALREPQVEAALARLASARAALDQAELDLERTKIHSPFRALVLERNAEAGTRVAPGDDVGSIVCLATYWVVASVPLSNLRWIDFGRDDGVGSEVRVRNRAAWPEDTYRTGRVLRLVGALAEESRLAQVLVSVPDPLALEPGSKGLPPMLLDAIVEVRIRTEPIRDVVKLDRDYLRMNDTVWTMEEGVLRIHEVDVAFRDAEHAYIRSGLDPGAQIVTTNLSTVVDGAPLRTADPASEEDGGEVEEAEVEAEGAAAGEAE